jgi:tetratricopeptide (TPR) repeat protein
LTRLPQTSTSFLISWWHFRKKKRYDTAVPAWKKALKLDPDDPPAHNNLGIALAETGKLDEAIAEYRKSWELNSGCFHTHNNLGSALAEKGMLDEHFNISRKPSSSFLTMPPRK